MKKNLNQIIIGLVCLISLVVTSNVTLANKIYITLPASNQYFCENFSTPDTIIIYKAAGFGSTIWYNDITYIGTGDSISYIPTSVGLVNISAIWNSNNVGVNMYFFTAAPSHPLISILSGGNYNSAHDTVRMCSSSVTMNAIINGNNIQYMQWLNPSNTVIATTANATITTPGRHIFMSSNACGAEYDTIYFVALPYSLPIIGPADTTFCNITVDLLLNPGSGWNYNCCCDLWHRIWR